MKPLDFGEAGVTGSIDSAGCVIALNFYHPQYGYVTLSSAPPFPESERYNPAVVRAYRASLANAAGFGVRFDPPAAPQSASLLEAAIPQIELEVGSEVARIVTFADARGAVQEWEANARVSWGGSMSLQRCAYTQLTEGGPLPMPDLRLRAFAYEDLLVIHNPVLGAAVAIAGLDVSGLAEQESDQPLQLDLPVQEHKLAYGVGLSVEEAVSNARWLAERATLEVATALWRSRLEAAPDDLLLRRALAYGQMMAVPVGEGTCLLTDHMLLPLSWNRDAYFAARALLSAGEREIVRRHLLWTFETAERQNNIWARCYLANGGVKDGAYQLDQQLYPLLELAEYVLETGDLSTAERLMPQVSAVLAAVETRRKPGTLLFSTDETPADDPIALPYHFSSHVLLWRTLSKLEMVGATGRWTGHVDELRESILAAFVAEREGERIFAYATDGAGRFHFYHDANDFPLALAPAWGFAAADDAVWRATVDFAFSPANRGGFYDGHLGSVHSPAPWALGDVQELIIARALGDAARAKHALASLRHIAQADGALPEAYDAATGAVFSRTWFLWPSAAYACAQLGTL